MSAPDFEALLGEHGSSRPAFIREADGNDWHRGVSVCSCGETFTGTHTAHVAAVLDDHMADRERALGAELEAAKGNRPAGFMSQREWEDWSNELAMLLPEDVESWPGVNPEGAQESIIEAAITYLTSDDYLADLVRAAAEKAVLEAAEALRHYADGFVGPFHAEQWCEAATYIAVRAKVGIPGPRLTAKEADRG